MSKHLRVCHCPPDDRCQKESAGKKAEDAIPCWRFVFWSLSSAGWGVIREHCALLAALGEMFCTNPVVMVLSLCWCLCPGLWNLLPIAIQSNSSGLPGLLTAHEKQWVEICSFYFLLYFFLAHASLSHNDIALQDGVKDSSFHHWKWGTFSWGWGRRRPSLGSVWMTEQGPYSSTRLRPCRLIELGWELCFLILFYYWASWLRDIHKWFMIIYQPTWVNIEFCIFHGMPISHLLYLNNILDRHYHSSNPFTTKSIYSAYGAVWPTDIYCRSLWIIIF